MNDRQKLLQFLQSQRLMAIASHDREVWICTVYYGITDDFRIYFISSEEAAHSRQILKNPRIAFSVAWFNPNDHTDRKAVQGRGTCRIATGEEIRRGVQLHNRHFPEFSGRITEDWIKSEGNKSHVWVIEPSSMKFWNDELYGAGETKEFEF